MLQSIIVKFSLNIYSLLQFRVIYIAFLLVLLYVLSSCNPARRIPDGRYLLNKNTIEIEEAEVQRSELTRFYRQRPNRRILGFYRFHLNMYLLADRGKETRFRRWMKNTIGEAPVIYDPSMAQNTVRQFEIYLHSKGYFNAEVDYTEKFKRQKAWITYQVKGNTPYTFNEVKYSIQDPFLAGFVLKDTVNTLIEHENRYDADVLHDERDRITRYLRNSGFYRFSRDFIIFQADSTLNQHKVNLEMRVSNPQRRVIGQRDSVVQERHKRYLIDQVVLLPEFTALTAHVPRTDTTIYVAQDRRDGKEFEYRFYHNGSLRIKPSVVVDHLLLRRGDYFQLSRVEQSYSFLSEMRNYRYINLHFDESEQPLLGEANDTLGFLNATVQLNRSATHAFTIEAEGLNTAGNLGVATNVLYQNRNIFRGAEIFNLRLKGALEVTGESGSDEVFQRLPFNTLEMGVEMGVDFPKLLLPMPLERLSRNSRPKSSVVAGINFRQRPDYTRYILNLNYGFEWNETSTKRHFIHPIEISSVRVFNDSILRANIPDANPFILSRFRDHFILGLKYTYMYNTQQMGKIADFMYLRTNFESAGNLLNLAAGQLDFSRDKEGSYNVFNIPFSQFVKGDADFRYYRVYDERQTLVFRVMGGIGVPYGNVKVLPFIKSYYGGGANGLRAWKIYTLGPGSYKGTDEIRFDRYGDIKLEANIEYRFKFYGFWQGAFFLDAGNVWFVRQNKQFPGGAFRISELANDIAIGGGMGVRLDFDFFILRIDAAVPIKDPARSGSEQWLSNWPAFRDFNVNLGIGYPF